MTPQDKSKVGRAFHEVAHHTPSTVTRAKVSKPRKQKMKIAIALNKARQAGAQIPYRGVKRG